MPVITVSRQTGCGEELCVKLSEKLGYKYFNKEMVSFAATLGGMSDTDAAQFDEYNYSGLYDLVASYFDLSLFSTPKNNMHEVSADEYARVSRPYEYSNSSTGESFFNAMEKVIRILANDSNVIIAGRGGNVLLKNVPSVLHIRLVAPMDMRVDNIKSAMNITKKQAEQYAIDKDKKKKSYVKSRYGQSVDDPLNYHFVINLGKIKTDEAVDMVINMLHKIN